jgi:hypothetical protein
MFASTPFVLQSSVHRVVGSGATFLKRRAPRAPGVMLVFRRAFVRRVAGVVAELAAAAERRWACQRDAPR